MPVQHEVWRLTGYKRGDSLAALAHLVGQEGCLHFQHVVIITVHDLPDTHLTSASNASSSLCSLAILLVNSYR